MTDVVIAEASGEASEPTGSETKAIRQLQVGGDDEQTRAAFEKIVARYFAPMSKEAGWEIGKSGVPVPADGEDAAQEMFLELRAAFLARSQWVHDIAINRQGLLVVMRRLTRFNVSAMVNKELAKRRGGGRVRREADLPEDELQVSCHYDPSQRMIAAEEVQEIEAKLREAGASSRVKDLGDQLAMIFQLWVAQHSTEDIARITGLELRTAQRRVELMMEVLKSHFGFGGPTQDEPEVNQGEDDRLPSPAPPPQSDDFGIGSGDEDRANVQ